MLNFNVFKQKAQTQTGLNLSAFGVKQKPKERTEFRTVSLPEHLGGGEYKTAGGGTLQIEDERKYGGLSVLSGHERDHIVSFALGGTNNIKNVEYKTSPKQDGKWIYELRQGGKVVIETKVINDYKAGKISLPEARAKIAHKQQQIKGLIPKQGFTSYLPTAIKETITGFGKGLLDFGKTILQAPQRAITSVGLECAASTLSLIKDKNIEAKYTPTGKFEKMLLGEEPIKGMFTRVEEAQKKSEELLQKIGIDKSSSIGASLVLAPLFVGGMTGLDLTPFGGGKNTAKAISLSKNSDEIFKLIKPIFKNSTDDQLKVLSKGLVKINKTAEVADIIKQNIAKGIKTTKAITKAEGLKAIPDELAMEEFMDKSKNISYHATNKDFTQFSKDAEKTLGRKLGDGTYFSNDLSSSKALASQMGKNGKILYSDISSKKLFNLSEDIYRTDINNKIVFNVPKDVLDIAKKYNIKSSKEFAVMASENTKLRNKIIKDAGYDGIKSSEKDILIFDASDIIIKTKSQLTEIFNKAEGLKAIPDEVFYHSTSKQAAEQIRKVGFKAQVGDRSLGITKGKGTFLYRGDKEAAEEFGKNIIRQGKELEIMPTKITGKIFNALDDEKSIRVLAEDTNLINKLKKQGFIGIEGDEMGQAVTFIFDTKSIKPIATKAVKEVGEEVAEKIKPIIKTTKPITKTAVKAIDEAEKDVIINNLIKFKSDPKSIPDFSMVEDWIKHSDKLTADDLYDITKYLDEKGVSPFAKTTTKGLRERGFVSSVKAEFPELEKVAGQYIPRSTDKLAMKAKNLIKADIQTAEKVARTQTDENAVAIASELIKHYSDEAAKTVDKGIKNTLYDKAAEITNLMARKLTEQGRSIQAASILSRLTPEGQVRYAAKEILKWNEFNPKKLIPELTGEQTKSILKEMQAIQRMAEGEEKAIRFFNLQKQIKNLVPTPLTKKLISIWKAGLLTGLKTSGLNIFANVHHSITEAIKDIPAAVVDSIASLLTGKRTLTFTTKSLGKGGITGVKKGWHYLKTGFDERNIAAKLDYQHINWGKNKVWKAIGKYTDGVFRVLGAEDQPFYYAAKARSLADQASAKAINKGLKGNARKEFIQKLIENPTEQMQKYASLDGMTAVFQQDTLLGKAARAIQKAPGGEIVVPFGKTPSAVATQIVNYTPIGIANTIIKNIGRGRFDQRDFAQGLGRGLTGISILGIGAYLFKKGKILLDYPTNERERELWKVEGKKPNTIKIGDKYRTIQAFGPAGNLLVVGGHIQNAFNSKGSPTEAMTEAFFGSAKSFTEQTFLQGMNNVVSAINDPERNAGRILKSTISSIIPTLSSDIARAFDPLERRTETIVDALKRKIPGARKTLEPQITILGEERARVGNALEVLADPTRPSEEISTILTNEFRRLWDLGYKVSPTLLGDRKGYEVLTSKENTNLWKKTGEIISSKTSNLIATDKYDKLSDEAKAKRIKEFIEKSQIVARAEIVIELTRHLTGKKLKEKLSELKAGKLLTRDVYDKYLELK